MREYWFQCPVEILFALAANFHVPPFRGAYSRLQRMPPFHPLSRNHLVTLGWNRPLGGFGTKVWSRPFAPCRRFLGGQLWKGQLLHNAAVGADLSVGLFSTRFPSGQDRIALRVTVGRKTKRQRAYISELYSDAYFSRKIGTKI